MTRVKNCCLIVLLIMGWYQLPYSEGSLDWVSDGMDWSGGWYINPSNPPSYREPTAADYARIVNSNTCIITQTGEACLTLDIGTLLEDENESILHVNSGSLNLAGDLKIGFLKIGTGQSIIWF
jgi:hypothetical protein